MNFDINSLQSEPTTSLDDFRIEHLLNSYDCGVRKKFEAELSCYLSLKRANFVFGPGGDGLLDHLFFYIGRKGAKIWIPKATYLGYEFFAQKHRLNYEFYDPDETSLSTCQIHRTDWVLICHPDAVTGRSQRNLVKNFGRFTSHFIFDETYCDYSREESFIDEIAFFESAAVVRSFSKFFLSPGLRLGYGVLNDRVHDELSRWNFEFPVAQFAFEIARRLILNKTEFEANAQAHINLAREIEGQIFPKFKNTQPLKTPFFSVPYGFCLESQELKSLIDRQVVKVDLVPDRRLTKMSVSLRSEVRPHWLAKEAIQQWFK